MLFLSVTPFFVKSWLSVCFLNMSIRFQHLLLVFLVFKMGLTTLAAQQFLLYQKNRRRQSRNINCHFFNFWVLFLKVYNFEVATVYLSQYLSNQLNISVVFCIYKIHVFNETSFLPSMITKKNYLFIISMATILRKTSSFIKVIWLFNPNYARTNGVKQRKATIKKLSQRSILCPNTKVRDPRTRVKMPQQLIFFLFLKPFAII